jgi:SAM-dependent methyltransferase
MTGFVFDVWSVLVLIGLGAMTGVALWTLIPRKHGISPIPSRRRWIRQAFDLAHVQPGETVYDLGSGDGRALIIAAREFGAQAVGYEVEPLHCAAAWIGALFAGVLGQVSIHCRDLYRADLATADVVFLHLNPRFVTDLALPLQSQLRPGARVVSLDFPFDSWEPSELDIGYLIFVYHMPPQPGSIESYLSKNLTLAPNTAKINDNESRGESGTD